MAAYFENANPWSFFRPLLTLLLFSSFWMLQFSWRCIHTCITTSWGSHTMLGRKRDVFGGVVKKCGLGSANKLPCHLSIKKFNGCHLNRGANYNTYISLGETLLKLKHQCKNWNQNQTSWFKMPFSHASLSIKFFTTVETWTGVMDQA